MARPDPLQSALDAAWFSTLGEPLGAGELTDIETYTLALGLPLNAPPLRVQSWQQAAEVLRGETGEWWALEEAERARLEQTVRLDSAAPAWIRVNDRLHGAAAVAAARSGCSDAAMIKVAAGASSYATYHYHLAMAAECGPDHAFIRKYALFSGGRWPLGIYDGRFAIF